MKKMWRGLFLVIAGLIANNVFAQSFIVPKVVLPHGGALVGTTMDTVNGRKVEAFLGIPYAEPPVGQLRFKAPIPAYAWTGIRRAQTPPTACVQSDIFSIDKMPFGDEDCLYLNVYVPWERPSANLPVMVWIHGGGYHMGSSDPILFGPERLLENDVVLITFNYRLGPLGFLSSGSDALPGNYGLKDQNMVLQWVRENIQVFGGNPYDVTLFGSSAGAASVSLHMVSDMSRGLFQKAIMQSGNYYDPWAFVDPHKAMERLIKLGEEVGCPQKNPTSNQVRMMRLISCLEETSASSLVSAIASYYIDETYFPITVFGPVIEPNVTGAFLTENPKNIIESHGTAIPLIIGVTSDEGIGRSGPILHQFDQHFRANYRTVLPKLLEYDNKPAHIRQRITERIDNFYFRDGHTWTKGNHQPLTDMFSDRYHYYGLDQYLRNRFAAINRPIGRTFVYVFGHRGPKSTSEMIGSGPEYYGVAHGDDVPFLFPYGQLNVPGTPKDQLMRWALPRMWTDFAWTGDPTPPGATIKDAWKPTRHFPLKYAQIGSKTPMKDYKSIRTESPRGQASSNFTTALEGFFANIELPHLFSRMNDFDTGSAEEYDPKSVSSDDTIRSPRARKHTKKKKLRNSKTTKKKATNSKKHKNNHKNKTHGRKSHYLIGNKKDLVEKRMHLWRGMERLLCE